MYEHDMIFVIFQWHLRSGPEHLSRRAEGDLDGPGGGDKNGELSWEYHGDKVGYWSLLVIINPYDFGIDWGIWTVNEMIWVYNLWIGVS